MMTVSLSISSSSSRPSRRLLSSRQPPHLRHRSSPASLSSLPVWSALQALYASSCLSPRWFDWCTPIGRLAVYRAILTQSPPSLLVRPTVPVDQFDSSAASLSLSSSSSFPCLLSSLFPLILSDCWSASPQLRYYALHCLEVWCSAVQLTLQSAILGSEPSLSPPASSVPSFLPDCLSRLLAVLSVNWEHPYRVIIGVSKQLFSHFVQLSALLARPGQPDLQSFARPLLSACLSHHDRGAYQQLNVLMPHVGALVLLRECPTLIRHGLTAACYQPMWGVVGGMMQRLLTQAKHEIDGAHSEASDGTAAVPSTARLSKRSKQKVKEKQRVEAVVLTAQAGVDEASAEWRQLWQAPVASSLLSDDEQTRQAVGTSLVAALLKLDPPSLAPLLSAVQTVPDPQETEHSSSAAGLSFRHLRALVCVLTTARRIGLISSPSAARLPAGR